MSSTADILRKKMRPPTAAVGPCLAWWQAEVDRVIRKTCKSAFQMDVKLDGLAGKQVLAPQALDDMPEIALPILLQTAAGGSALFVLDGPLIDGLIEQQLLGEVLRTQRLNRPVTTIDAGLSEPFVKAALQGITAEATGQLTGLSYDRTEQDRAALRLALGEGLFDIVQAEMDMGPGVKTGKFEIWVPAIAMKKAAKATKKQNPDMSRLLSSCKVELETWLEGCEASAQQLMNLEVGAVMLIPRSALIDAAVKDANGNPFARARLGQLHGARAARLTKLHGKAPPAGPQAIEATPTSATAIPATEQPTLEESSTFDEGLQAKDAVHLDKPNTALTG